MALLRFAPSPTGPLHLGGLRTALLNYLYARKLGGKWILRIEDTDTSRLVPGSVDGMRRALEWAGIEYDYGPGKGGPQGPFYQTERLDLYHSYARKLLDSGHAYRCFCSPTEMAEIRERFARTGSSRTYDRRCIHITDEEVARRVRAGENSVVRLNEEKVPPREKLPDLVFGDLKESRMGLPTDPVLLKSDLFPTYHLASVVDDHEMGITHVLRGEEWIPSLPLHLDLYASLSLTPPRFAHIPIVLNKDGSKMSKRNGDVQVEHYIERGWEPVAVLNWLALVGWGASHDAEHNHAEGPSATGAKYSPAPDSTTLMSLPEMVEQFDLANLTHRRSVLDPTRLEHLNQHHLMQTARTDAGLRSLAERVHEGIKEAYPLSPYTSIEYLMDVFREAGARFVNINDIYWQVPYFFVEPDYSTPEAQAVLEPLSPQVYNLALKSLLSRLLEPDVADTPWQDLDFRKLFREHFKGVGIEGKDYMRAMRHALTGKKDGPQVPDLTRLLGRDRVLRRLERAIS